MADSRTTYTAIQGFAPICLFQVICTSVAVVLAAIQINLLLVALMLLLCFVGLAVAIGGSLEARHPLPVFFGLSSVVMPRLATELLWPFPRELGAVDIPGEFLLIGYEIVAVPVGLWAYYVIATTPPGQRARLQWQFGLPALLKAALLAALAFGLSRLMYQSGSSGFLSISVGTLVWTLVMCGVVIVRVWRANRTRARAEVAYVGEAAVVEAALVEESAESSG